MNKKKKHWLKQKKEKKTWQTKKTGIGETASLASTDKKISKAKAKISNPGSCVRDEAKWARHLCTKSSSTSSVCFFFFSFLAFCRVDTKQLIRLPFDIVLWSQLFFRSRVTCCFLIGPNLSTQSPFASINTNADAYKNKTGNGNLYRYLDSRPRLYTHA